MDPDVLDHDLFEALRPLGGVDPLDDDVRARARALLPQPGPHRIGRRAVLTGATAAAAAVVLGVVVTRPDAPPTDAAAFLNRTALVAADQAGPDARHAAYWYSEARTRQAGQGWTTRQVWIGNQRPGRIPLPADFDASTIKEYKPGTTVEDLEALDVGLFGSAPGGGSITWPDLWTLPTDPDALAAYLREGSAGQGNGPDQELFVVAGDMLRESPAPPALRSALYRVLAGVPGVRLVGSVEDDEGRSGVAVEYVEDGTDGGAGDAYRYVIDPATGRLLQESSGGYTAVYLKEGPVTDDHATP